MVKRARLEKAVGVLESMYVAHLAKIDGDAKAARSYGRMKTPECRERAKLLRDAVKERSLAADALGTVIDAVRETLAEEGK